MKPNDKAIEAGVKLCWDCPRATPSMIRDILTAAYAAQFPPSEDYARLVEELREDVLQFNLKDTAYENIANEAADAIEALLAERDALKHTADAHVKGWMGQCAIASAAIKERDNLVKERDTLLARLAPVDDKELEAKAAAAIIAVEHNGIDDEFILEARAVIAAIRPHIEAAERERCAKIAERKKKQKYYDPNSIGWEGEWEIVDEFPKDGKEIAAAIRSGK